MNDKFPFAERVRKARKSRDLSQVDAANLVGISREMWGKYERGVAHPSGDVIARMNGAGFDVAYILGGAELDAINDASKLTKADLARMDIAPNALIASAIVGFKTLGEPAAGHLANLYRGLKEDQRARGVRCADGDEESLIANYRRADERGRKVISETAAALADHQPGKPK